MTACLATPHSYFTILVGVFTNHISAENTFHESYKMNRTQVNTKLFSNVMILKTFLSTISNIAHFFTKQKFCKHHFFTKNNKS